MARKKVNVRAHAVQINVNLGGRHGKGKRRNASGQPNPPSGRPRPGTEGRNASAACAHELRAAKAAYERLLKDYTHVCRELRIYRGRGKLDYGNRAAEIMRGFKKYISDARKRERKVKDVKKLQHKVRSLNAKIQELCDRAKVTPQEYARLRQDVERLQGVGTSYTTLASALLEKLGINVADQNYAERLDEIKRVVDEYARLRQEVEGENGLRAKYNAIMGILNDLGIQATDIEGYKRALSDLKSAANEHQSCSSKIDAAKNEGINEGKSAAEAQYKREIDTLKAELEGDQGLRAKYSALEAAHRDCPGKAAYDGVVRERDEARQAYTGLHQGVLRKINALVNLYQNSLSAGEGQEAGSGQQGGA
ncbi:MAG: hypothetical protein QXF55_00585 [Candidatus Aenigmatarchaeota archaeon]